MEKESRAIELLSPAKDLTCGVEAINHGADAVYIGAPRFGARSAAGNTVEDIRTLCDYAHLYSARVYVALNTILREEELKEAERIIHRLYEAGADALIVQDMGITRLDLPPIPLHASTQMDNRTVEKVRFLEEVGFSQVVLARELTIDQIREIARRTTVPLEVFVHGALCVSYSGQCYLSAALSGRSANRGECAQYCRLPYDLIDAKGERILAGKHLLSLKDLSQGDHLEELLDAGVHSLKIEGRLKDVSYVKNITAWYRKRLDELFARRPEYRKASAGSCAYTFEPDVEKSFNRGFTSYFLHGRSHGIASPDTPKFRGEPVGTLKAIKGNALTIAASAPLGNGDGLTFFNDKGELEGFRVNRVEANRIFTPDRPSLRLQTLLYRNHDQRFESLLSKPSAERKIAVRLSFVENAFGFTLGLTDETGARVMLTRPFPKERARKSQEENIRSLLSKLGATPFAAREVEVELSGPWFVPSSLLADMRRDGVERLLALKRIRHCGEAASRGWGQLKDNGAAFPERKLTYRGNVSNSQAEAFYKGHQVAEVEKAFELSPRKEVPLMFAKHCLRYSMGWCPRWQKGKSPYAEPYYLRYKGIRLRLRFDCARCQMEVYAEE